MHIYLHIYILIKTKVFYMAKMMTICLKIKYNEDTIS